MALIRCPECNKKISDTCDKCIHCGYELKGHIRDIEYESAYEDLSSDDKLSSKILKVLGIVLGALLAAAAVALVIFIISTYKQRDALTNEIMATAAILSFTFGVAAVILCNKLL